MTRHGFTLIELLVVVAIIVALLAMLSPSIGGAVNLAHATACLSNQRQLTAASLGFTSDHFGTLIGAETENGWTDTKNPWVVHNATPETNKTMENGALWSYVNGAYDLYLCPAEDRKYVRSYSISTYLHGHDGPSYPNDVPVRSLSNVFNPSGQLAFIDDNDPRGYNWGSFHGGPWSYHKQYTIHNWGDYPAARHGSLLPHSLADGSGTLYRYVDAVAMRAAGYGTLVTNNEDFEYVRRVWSPYD